MLNKILLGIAIVVVIFAAYVGYILTKTKIESPLEIVQTTYKGVTIKVDYSRPSKKGRKIFGGLVPYGKYWRTGANEATHITFSRDVSFGDEIVVAGTYWLYTIPDEESWTVGLNREQGAWGIPGPNLNLDVLRIQAIPKTVPDVTEQFEISLEDKETTVVLKMAWDHTEVQIPIVI